MAPFSAFQHAQRLDDCLDLGYELDQSLVKFGYDYDCDTSAFVPCPKFRARWRSIKTILENLKWMSPDWIRWPYSLKEEIHRCLEHLCDIFTDCLSTR
jgi:hypothetical protein